MVHDQLVLRKQRFMNGAAKRAVLAIAMSLGGASVHAAGDATKDLAPPMTENQIAALDGNRDGKITREEAASRKDLLDHWAELDRNGDQLLEASEISGSGGGPL